jgi:hypothetical protein
MVVLWGQPKNRFRFQIAPFFLRVLWLDVNLILWMHGRDLASELNRLITSWLVTDRQLIPTKQYTLCPNLHFGAFLKSPYVFVVQWMPDEDIIKANQRCHTELTYLIKCSIETCEKCTRCRIPKIHSIGCYNNPLLVQLQMDVQFAIPFRYL